MSLKGVDGRFEATPASSSSITTTHDSSHHDAEKARPEVFEELDVTAPSHATDSLERWNFPTVNMWRFFLTLLSFFVLGANDAAVGALIPYVSFSVCLFELSLTSML